MISYLLQHPQMEIYINFSRARISIKGSEGEGHLLVTTLQPLTRICSLAWMAWHHWSQASSEDLPQISYYFHVGVKAQTHPRFLSILSSLSRETPAEGQAPNTTLSLLISK